MTREIFSTDHDLSDVDVVEESISEEDWQQVAPQNILLEDFINADNQVITHNEGEDEAMDASSDEEGEDDEELERTVISNGTAMQYVQQIKTWYLAGDNDSTDFWSWI
ncbi:unnamed protein product [Allacma fusca]|uniref:Uncharacterized protein n=1 Tax=Allacma fusca TaxID=39272 RepID=A0A8J2KB78_9HEXA|nr:unnamed protein product [Allacma fusca]